MELVARIAIVLSDEAWEELVQKEIDEARIKFKRTLTPQQAKSHAEYELGKFINSRLDTQLAEWDNAEFIEFEANTVPNLQS